MNTDVKTKPTINAFVEDRWLNRRVSKNTQEAYRCDLSKLECWLRSNLDKALIDATTSNLERFFEHLQSKGLAASTLARVRSTVRQFYSWAKSESMLEIDPADKLGSYDSVAPAVTSKTTVVLSDSQTNRLINSLLESADPLKLRNGLMMALVLETGLQSNELICLQCKQFVRRHRGWRLRVTRNKKPIDYKLSAELSQQLERFFDRARTEILLEKMSGYLFVTHRGDKMTRTAFWSIVKKRGEVVKPEISVNPDLLRKTYAYHLKQSGVELSSVMKCLGIADSDSARHLLDSLQAPVDDQTVA
ncbi:MAG: tyrosine-type recombinase/integrase [Gammaproteobacteria bacterium]|nr:tyrosine-type recombinase/integrase [Gammaproteobacteria bacterium]